MKALETEVAEARAEIERLKAANASLRRNTAIAGIEDLRRQRDEAESRLIEAQESLRQLREVRDENNKFRLVIVEQECNIQETLGTVLFGHPDNIGEHTAETLAVEAAKEIRRLLSQDSETDKTVVELEADLFSARKRYSLAEDELEAVRGILRSESKTLGEFHRRVAEATVYCKRNQSTVTNTTAPYLRRVIEILEGRA